LELELELELELMSRNWFDDTDTTIGREIDTILSWEKNEIRV
jgi:hypothetical protein